MIDSDGYRANVGIILSNPEGKVLWARRMGQDAWQFPQGGIDHNEDAEQAMYRELWEEVGLRADDVNIIAATSSWVKWVHMVSRLSDLLIASFTAAMVLIAILSSFCMRAPFLSQ